MSAPAPTLSPELKALLRRLRLGQLTDTLPRRLALAKAHSLSHHDFLEQLLADEVARRDRTSAGVRARAAHLDPQMVLEAFDETAAITYDRAVLAELVSLRFVEEARNGFILGPTGVGKTFLATALGHIACRRRISVHFERGDRLATRLKAARLDQSYEAELRKLIAVELLVVDDLCLQALDATETADFYELVVERHHHRATVVTSNPDPSEWLALMADPMLAQSAVDRLASAAYELVIEGESTPPGEADGHPDRRGATSEPPRAAGPGAPALTAPAAATSITPRPWRRGPTWPLAAGNRMVPSGWQSTPSPTASTGAARSPGLEVPAHLGPALGGVPLAGRSAHVGLMGYRSG